MKKLYWLMLSAIALLPLISATDSPHGFDLYYLFVENIFGGWLAATLGMLGIFIIIGLLSRMTMTSIFMLTGLFLVASLVGFIGLPAVFLFGLVAIYYFFAGLVKWIMGWNT